MEVLMMLMAGTVKDGEPRSFSVPLLEWYKLQEELVLVMGRPIPSKDLYDHIMDNGGQIKEDEGRVRQSQYCLLTKQLMIQSYECFYCITSIISFILQEIFRQLIECLVSIHSKGVLHRDIKPENILVQTVPEGLRLHVLDFSSACVLQERTYTEFCGMDLLGILLELWTPNIQDGM